MYAFPLGLSKNIPSAVYPLILLCRAMVALEHPLLKDGGILSPLIASLAQWHLVDNPEQSLGSPLMDSLKSALREVDMLKRALSQVWHVGCRICGRALGVRNC